MKQRKQRSLILAMALLGLLLGLPALAGGVATSTLTTTVADQALVPAAPEAQEPEGEHPAEDPLILDLETDEPSLKASCVQGAPCRWDWQCGDGGQCEFNPFPSPYAYVCVCGPTPR